jgi:hypothetical protein
LRPPRADIAVPELPPRLRWIGDAPESMAALTEAGPVLVNFFDVAHLSSVRALPYLNQWSERYASDGLAVLWVHSPRFPCTTDRDAVAAAAERLRIPGPVALDLDYSLWRDYGCKGWPSLFLWSPGGALEWFHFGEGEYANTEEAIQELLRADQPLLQLPAPVEPLRASDAPGALVAAPTAEILPGGSLSQPWCGDGELALEYAAGGAYATVDGSGEVRVRIDDAQERQIAVRGPSLIELASHPHHEEHRLRIEAAAGVRVWAISFAAGIPA